MKKRRYQSFSAPLANSLLHAVNCTCPKLSPAIFTGSHSPLPSDIAPKGHSEASNKAAKPEQAPGPSRSGILQLDKRGSLQTPPLALTWSLMRYPKTDFYLCAALSSLRRQTQRRRRRPRTEFAALLSPSLTSLLYLYAFSPYPLCCSLCSLCSPTLIILLHIIHMQFLPILTAFSNRFSFARIRLEDCATHQLCARGQPEDCTIAKCVPEDTWRRERCAYCLSAGVLCVPEDCCACRGDCRAGTLRGPHG